MKYVTSGACKIKGNFLYKINDWRKKINHKYSFTLNALDHRALETV